MTSPDFHPFFFNAIYAVTDVIMTIIDIKLYTIIHTTNSNMKFKKYLIDRICDR